MSRWPARVHRLFRLVVLEGIRLTPLSWRVKSWLIWLGGPKVVFAACALVEDGQGRVLVLRSRYSGAWQFPGGCVRRREAALAALHRECREELSLDIHDVHLIGIYVDMGGLAQCALYRCRLGSGPIRLSVEHTEARYAAADELPSPLRRMVQSAALRSH